MFANLSFSQVSLEKNIVEYIEKHGLGVFDITFQSSSYWISTRNGLIKYDGTSFSYFFLKSGGPLDSNSISANTYDTVFSDLYNLYSNNEDLWAVPQYTSVSPNSLYIYKINKNTVYKYEVYVSEYSRDYNIDNMTFDKNNSPALHIRYLLKKDGVYINGYDVFTLIDNKFSKKNLAKSPDESIYLFSCFNGIDYTLLQVATEEYFVLKLRFEDNSGKEIILDKSKELYSYVKSYNYKDTRLLVTFYSNGKNIFLFLDSNYDYKYYQPDSIYRKESEGFLIGENFYYLYNTGIFEQNFLLNSFKKINVIDCKDCFVSNEAKIKGINNYLWCLFRKRYEYKNNNNVFLHKF